MKEVVWKTAESAKGRWIQHLVNNVSTIRLDEKKACDNIIMLKEEMPER